MLGSRRWRFRAVFGLVALFIIIVISLVRSSPGALAERGRELHRLSVFMNHERKTVRNSTKSSVDWANIKFKHMPPKDMTQLPKGTPKQLPRIQHDFANLKQADIDTQKTRQDRVRKVFEKDWASYRELAWGEDALNPISGKPKDQFAGWAATLVDSLDVLWIMGLRTEFDEAVAAVAKLDFGKATTNRVNMFESNIRYLGGLLSAYDLSGDPALLEKATEMGDMLYTGYNTVNRMPVDFINFESAKKGEVMQVEGNVVSASPGTLSLEMTHLSQVTGDSKYYDAVNRVMQHFAEAQNTTKIPGLWPMRVSMSSLDFSASEFTMGGNADSLFEYLPKMYLMLGGLEPMYENMTRNFVDAATEYLFFRPMLPNGEDILISGNVDVTVTGHKPLDPESEHLTCFIGGAVGLAGKMLKRDDYVQTGDKLAKGCGFVYRSFASGIMPERYNMVPCEPKMAKECPWDEAKYEAGCKQRTQYVKHLPKGFTTAKDPRYLLRPEAIESLFLLYRMTGDMSYQETAWKMFTAVEEISRAEHGHAAVLDVTKVGDEAFRTKNLEDYMESFWFAETLKYYYLMFSPPELISLDEYVLNTEAHPFKRPLPKTASPKSQ